MCLRCRADAHRLAAAARLRSVARVGGGALAFAGALALGNTMMTARRHPAPAARVSPPEAGLLEATRAEAMPLSQPQKLPLPSPSPRPVIAAGRTTLAEGMYAERSADSVSVHFDRPMLRTRRPEKFEQVVRATLPATYGALADSALAQVPEGSLASSGDLLVALPAQGILLPASRGTALTLWPITRPGQDGPLVVGYRVSIAP